MDDLFDTGENLYATWNACENDVVIYPIYVPSLGRATTATTPNFLDEANLPFFMVVEAHEYEAYVAQYGKGSVLSLPGSHYGGPAFVRNWIKEHATAQGARSALADRR